MEINSQNPAPIVPTNLTRGKMPSKGAIAALVISNSVPLFGAIFWNWDVASILILFWLENVVIGLYTLLKIATARGVPQQPLISNISGTSKKLYSKKAYFFFFILHYGMFTFVHGVFVFKFFGTGNAALWAASPALLGLFLSHGFSYWSNFIQRGEYLTASPDRQMLSPYKRVIVMHLAVMTGGFFAVLAPFSKIFLIPPVAILVILKIIVDIFSHLYEHNALPAGIIIVKGISGNTLLRKK